MTSQPRSLSSDAVESASPTRKPATLDDIRPLGTVPVWSATRPDAADALGIGRALAYQLAQRGELPTIRLGSRVVVPVPALLRMLGESDASREPAAAASAGLSDVHPV